MYDLVKYNLSVFRENQIYIFMMSHVTEYEIYDVEHTNKT